MQTAPPAAIILAAGASRRLGQPKQALRHAGESLLRRTARLALATGVQPVVVVLGAGAVALRPLLDGLPVTVVDNPAWAEGMGSSIRAGMTAVPVTAPAVLLLVVDQPGLDQDQLQALLAAPAATGCSMAASAYGGRLGVPALFTQPHFAALAALDGAAGAQILLRRQPEAVAAIPFPAGAWDIDTPADLDRLQP